MNKKKKVQRMKNKITDSKGISLISLVITIIVLIIVSNMIIYNLKDNIKLRELIEMQSDIDNLRDKVSTYYMQNGKIPANIKYRNINAIKDSGVISDSVDIGDFFVIDLSAIQNLTLNKGQDFEKIKNNPENVDNYTDLYIINEKSHNVFYVAGVTVDNKTFYTDYTEDEVDTASVTLKYVDNVQVPDGFYYVQGTRDKGIIIRSNDNTQEYKWIQQEEEIVNIPSDVEIEKSEQENFIKSVNAYQGYYKNTNSNKVIYLGLENWSPAYDKEGVYQDKNGDTAYIPKGFCVSQTPGENTIDGGLVVKDTNNNQWVWIEVPKSIYIAAESSEDYENIEKDMQTYVNDYRESNDRDTWGEEAQHGFVSAEEYNEWKNKMLKSVYEKGGFYIGRYEVGTKTVRTSTSTTETPAMIQKNCYPYHYVTCKQAQMLAKNLATEGKTASLMFGVQWDLVLKQIETKGDKTKDELTLDSSTWGNYKNTQNSLVQTGVSHQTSTLNIYDLAGNVWEWTLETSTNDSHLCVIRGGSYVDDGASFPVSCRYDNSYSDSNNTLGFRAVLY